MKKIVAVAAVLIWGQTPVSRFNQYWVEITPRRNRPIRVIAGLPGTIRPPPTPNRASTSLVLAVEARVSFLLYAIGFVVFVTGLAWLATMAGISQGYVLIGASVLLCIGVFTAIARATARDPA
jgi:hypothetical protein